MAEVRKFRATVHLTIGAVDLRSPAELGDDIKEVLMDHTVALAVQVVVDPDDG